MYGEGHLGGPATMFKGLAVKLGGSVAGFPVVGISWDALGKEARATEGLGSQPKPSTAES